MVPLIHENLKEYQHKYTRLSQDRPTAKSNFFDLASRCFDSSWAGISPKNLPLWCLRLVSFVREGEMEWWFVTVLAYANYAFVDVGARRLNDVKGNFSYAKQIYISREKECANEKNPKPHIRRFLCRLYIHVCYSQGKTRINMFVL